MRGILLIPVLLALALCRAAVDEETGVRQWLHLRGELADSQARIAALQVEVDGLRAEAQRLEADEFELERAIREELELARPGQTVIRLRRVDVSSDRNS